MNSASQKIVWDELSTFGNVVVETNVTQTVQVSYVLGAGQILSLTDSAGTAYLLPDVQGSTRLLTDASATI